jgi:NADPH:quinone reductase-like Zn-dependent oxidoreductase
VIVQVAKAMEAEEIVATCSKPNFGLVKDLGADSVIDYRDKKPLHEYLTKEFGPRKFDLVVDTVGAQELYLARENKCLTRWCSGDELC